MKTCSRCKIEKDGSCFRTIHDKRGRGSVYLSSQCNDCGRIKAALYYAKKKDDAGFKEKNRRRQKDYANANIEKIKMCRETSEYAKKHAKWELNRYCRMKDIISAKMKVKRQTEGYKKMIRDYRKRNKDKIYQQEVLTKKRYHEKHRDAVTDEYVKRQLITQDVATREMLEQPENYPLIEAKRLQILIKRKIKNNGN